MYKKHTVNNTFILPKNQTPPSSKKKVSFSTARIKSIPRMKGYPEELPGEKIVIDHTDDKESPNTSEQLSIAKTNKGIHQSEELKRRASDYFEKMGQKVSYANSGYQIVPKTRSAIKRRANKELLKQKEEDLLRDIEAARQRIDSEKQKSAYQQKRSATRRAKEASKRSGGKRKTQKRRT